MIAAYLVAIIGMSFAFARRQRTGGEYFLAGRSMGGLVLALSILANQVSAVSLVGAPAFVALRPGGGLRWLQYELALPLAMIAAIALLLPTLRLAAGSSIYQVTEQRFGPAVRRAVAATFLLSRGLAVGVVLYASALVAGQAFGWSVDAAIVAIGLFALVYTGLAGIVADIWSDVVQLVLLWGGTLAGAAVILARHGLGIVSGVADERLVTIVPSTGFSGGETFGVWPMLVGGLFLYVSYYACDQTQAQRLLTARSDAAARRALLLNGLLRFPLVATYCAFGALLAGLLAHDAAFASRMEGLPPDSLVPVFMTTYLPAGVRGLFMAGILAAAMSSIDSALNSLAAVSLEDVLGMDAARQSVAKGRMASVAWGLFAVASGLVFARSGSGVLELINRIGSAFYGPVLAVFLLAALAPRLSPGAVLAGLAGGLAANAAIGALAPGVSWLWWNPAGCLVAMVLALAAGRAGLHPAHPVFAPRREAALLGAAFAAMLALLVALPGMLAA